jgi:two-component system, OmpR family, sensor kinase
MVRLWRRLVRLWHPLHWIDRLGLVALGLLCGLALVTVLPVSARMSYDVLLSFAPDQKSHLALFAGERAYLDSLSAAVLPALARRDPRELADALDRAQGEGYPGIAPRFVILDFPDGTVLSSSDPRRFPVQSVVPDELRTRFPGTDGFGNEPGTDRAWLARTLRTDGLRVGRLFAEVDIPGLERDRERDRRDARSRLRWSWVIGCLEQDPKRLNQKGDSPI